MFFNKEKKKSPFVKGKSLEARKKQKEAIWRYYVEKNKKLVIATDLKVVKEKL